MEPSWRTLIAFGAGSFQMLQYPVNIVQGPGNLYSGLADYSYGIPISLFQGRLQVKQTFFVRVQAVF